MGKRPNRGQWAGSAQEYASYSSYPEASWQYWPGAWSPKGHDPSSWSHGSTQVFPAYDDQKRVQALAKASAFPKGHSKGKAAEQWGPAPDPSDSWTQFLQDAINSTRKAEQRVRSLAATRAKKEALWTKYLEDMKQTLQREHLRHQKEVERVSADLQAATLVQDDARAHLRQSWEAVARGSLPAAEAMETEGDTWEAMLTSWQTEQHEKMASHAVLQRALGSAAQVESPMPSFRDAVHTPPRRGLTAPTMTPPAVAAAAAHTPPGLSRTTDPYMTSPGPMTMPDQELAQGHTEDQEQDTAPEPPLPSRPKSTEPRTPVKKLPAGVHHAAASLHKEISDKLEQKRSHLAHQQGNAMQPFRVPASGPPPSSGHDPPPQDRNLLSACTEVDSEDELLWPPTNPKPESKMA